MKHRLRRVLVPALLVTVCVGLASVLAVPEEQPDRPLTPEEIARIDSFVGRFRQGQRLLGSGRDADAEVVFRALLEEEPKAAAVHHALGVLLGFRGRPDEATAALLRAAELAPKDAAIQRDAGADLLRRGRPAEAEPYFARARKQIPDEVEILVGHATALRAVGRVAHAQKAYRAALDVEPASVDARVGLAASLVAEDPAQAIDLVVELPHLYVDVALVHGLALAALDRGDEAIPHLVTATSTPPATSGSMAILQEGARALGRLGAAKEAATASALWCAAAGERPGLEPSLLLASSLAAIDRGDDALKVLAQANAERAPAVLLQRAALIEGALHLRADRADEAKAAFARAADSASETPERAIARRALGRIDAAALAAVVGDESALANDAAWAESLAAALVGDPAAAAAHAEQARTASTPAGEFPGLLVR